ncbi:MAG TPA: hypothetical protein VH022_12155 [Candidatus Acidoferrum sp.]|nr:hypothetical protein [Candidatus Acidoferrum sp.]
MVSLLALLFLGAAGARADVAVLLEEPYSYDGAFAGTGHAAVYLSNICADSPVSLRRCLPGESGVVISRYHRIAGYDWIAVPLYPYLYAVNKPQDIPLFADVKLESALRDHYRREYLEQLVPDGPEGEVPTGDWYELVGSAYDRTLYAFQLPTSVAQDDAFIAHYNSRSNREEYKFVTRNCADFVKDAVNFYYPKAVRRGLISELGVSTPKHAAKTMVQYAKKHPELQMTAFVIPQVPGTIRRSKPVRGALESVFKAKKYEVTLLALHPVVGGAFAAGYFLGGGPFNPSKNSLVFSPDGDLQAPLSPEDRKSYQKGLDEMMHANADAAPRREEATWHKLLDGAQLHLDAAGRPVLAVRSGDEIVEVGITRDNVLNSAAPRSVVQDLLVARMREQLRSGHAPKTSDLQVRQDWKLLSAAFEERPETASGQSSSSPEIAGGGTN